MTVIARASGRYRISWLLPPTMAAGVSDRLDIVALVEANEARAEMKRGPYKKGIS